MSEGGKSWCVSRAFRASEQKDSLILIGEREALELHLIDIAHDIDQLQAEQEKAEIRRIQLVIVGLLALAYADTIIAGLLAFATGTMLFPALIGSRMPDVSFMTSPLSRH